MRIAGTVATLPDSGFGPRTLIWWGTLCFILIEAGGFLLSAGSYLFLMSHTSPWPPQAAPPDVRVGAGFLTLLLLSEIPNVLTNRAAHAQKERPVRYALLAMSCIGVLLLVVRFIEMNRLNVHWTANAYGSILWAIFFLHTVHVVTDLGDTIVLTAFSWMRPMETSRYSDVADNCLYWHFVVLGWLPLAALVYGAPRWLQ